MAVSTAIAIFFLIWWVVLFAVLPWGARAQGEGGAPGTDPGAPVVPRIMFKLIWTTIIACGIFACGAFIYVNRLITLDDLAAIMGMK